MRAVFIFIVLTMITIGAYADVYVVYNEASQEVVSVSPLDDAVIEPGNKVEIIPIEWEDLELRLNPHDYKIINKKLVENIQKISDKENIRIKAQKKAEEESLIAAEMKRQAYESLKASGEKFTEITEDDFQTGGK